jgi:hypothetical protein
MCFAPFSVFRHRFKRAIRLVIQDWLVRMNEGVVDPRLERPARSSLKLGQPLAAIGVGGKGKVVHKVNSLAILIAGRRRDKDAGGRMKQYDR